MAQTNAEQGLANWFNSLVQYAGRPFQPGGRLDILHGGILNTAVPGSLGNSGAQIVGHLFGTDQGAVEMQKSLNYALSPVTGPPAPATPPGRPFGKPAETSAALPANARGVRNNNPLNLTISPFTENQPGFAGTDAGGRYAIFASVDAGRAAGEKLLNSYISRGYDTPAEIIGRWAPASENGRASTSNYAAYVAAGLGIGPNDKVSKSQIPQLFNRMAEFENGARSGPALSAFQTAASNVGLNQPMPQFDASGYRQADAFLAQAQQNSMRPFGAQYQETPAPELPKPDALQTPDYTAGDQALAAAQPKNPFGATPEEQAAGQLKLRRGDYFAGMAQALGSIDWSRGVGLGELFAKLGAGALMGAKAGDTEVQNKMDAFDKAMQQYQLAVANRDDRKAQEANSIANQNIVALNNYKNDQWRVQFQDWQKHEPQIVDGVLVTKTKMPDGTTQEVHTPLNPAVQSAALLARANNALAASNAQNNYDWQTYRANRELAGAALPYAMADASSQGNAQGRDGIAAIGLSEASIAATETGQWEGLYQRYMPDGATRVSEIKTEAARLANVTAGGNPTEAQLKAMNSYIQTQVLQDFVNAGRSWVLVGGPAHNPKLGNLQMNPAPEVSSAVATQREQDRKTTRTTNAKGQVTTTERY